MAAIDELVKDFLAQKTIAVVGLSATRDLPANRIYQTLRQRGYQVYAVSPHMDLFDGDPCYPDLKSLPVVPDGVVSVARPEITLAVVQECVALGVRRVWMHDMRGTQPKFARTSGESLTSVSAEAVRLCQEQGITVIAGSCPMQFIGDFGHACMRVTLRMIGALNLPPPARKAA